MDTFREELFQATQDFLHKAVALSRQAAVGTLQLAFESHGGISIAPARSSGSPRSKIGADASRVGQIGKTGRTDKSRGVKRSPDDLEKISQRFFSFVGENPGLRIEQINKQIGTSTKDLALPIRKLVASGVLIQDGKKRSTTYRAATGSSTRAEKSRSKSRSRSRKR